MTKKTVWRCPFCDWEGVSDGFDNWPATRGTTSRMIRCRVEWQCPSCKEWVEISDDCDV